MAGGAGARTGAAVRATLFSSPIPAALSAMSGMAIYHGSLRHEKIIGRLTPIPLILSLLILSIIPDSRDTSDHKANLDDFKNKLQAYLKNLFGEKRIIIEIFKKIENKPTRPGMTKNEVLKIQGLPTVKNSVIEKLVELGMMTTSEQSGFYRFDPDKKRVFMDVVREMIKEEKAKEKKHPQKSLGIVGITSLVAVLLMQVIVFLAAVNVEPGAAIMGVGLVGIVKAGNPSNVKKGERVIQAIQIMAEKSIAMGETVTLESVTDLINGLGVIEYNRKGWKYVGVHHLKNKLLKDLEKIKSEIEKEILEQIKYSKAEVNEKVWDLKREGSKQIAQMIHEEEIKAFYIIDPANLPPGLKSYHYTNPRQELVIVVGSQDPAELFYEASAFYWKKEMLTGTDSLAPLTNAGEIRRKAYLLAGVDYLEKYMFVPRVKGLFKLKPEREEEIKVLGKKNIEKRLEEFNQWKDFRHGVIRDYMGKAGLDVYIAYKKQMTRIAQSLAKTVVLKESQDIFQWGGEHVRGLPSSLPEIKENLSLARIRLGGEQTKPKEKMRKILEVIADKIEGQEEEKPRILYLISHLAWETPYQDLKANFAPLEKTWNVLCEYRKDALFRNLLEDTDGLIPLSKKQAPVLTVFETLQKKNIYQFIKEEHLAVTGKEITYPFLQHLVKLAAHRMVASSN
ncbi:hypothetical protein KAR10_08010, partial [bacterium]|nr:hypothetical protein [bacterium]